MNTLHKIGILFLIFLLASFLIFFSTDRNRVSFGGSGAIEKGQKFGIKIGDLRQDAIKHLENSDFVDVTSLGPVNTSPQLCQGVVYIDGITVDIFSDETWRSGAICLASQNGIIVKVTWDYGFMEI